METELAEHYDVTIATVRPGTHPQALAALDKTLAGDSDLLACWYSEIGALNRILIIRKSADAGKAVENRFAALSARNLLGRYCSMAHADHRTEEPSGSRERGLKE